MIIDELKFPVFAFGKTDQKDQIEENMIYVIPTIKDFTIATLYGLKSDYFINQEIVDSNGNVYWIEKVNFVGYVGASKYLPILGNRRKVQISFEYYDKFEKITLEDFKKRIIPMVENLKDIWEEAYGDIEDLKTLILYSKSFEKIAELLG